jgi:hypothetical protein
MGKALAAAMFDCQVAPDPSKLSTKAKLLRLVCDTAALRQN